MTKQTTPPSWILKKRFYDLSNVFLLFRTRNNCSAKINVSEPETCFSNCETKSTAARQGELEVRNEIQPRQGDGLKPQMASQRPETILDPNIWLFCIRTFFCESLRLRNRLQPLNLLFCAPRCRFWLFNDFEFKNVLLARISFPIL